MAANGAPASLPVTMARPGNPATGAEPICGFASRGQNGVFLVDGPFPAPAADEARFQTSRTFAGHSAPNCRVFAFSPDGVFFAFHAGDKVEVINTTNGQLLLSLDMPRTQFICFSSKGTILCLWEQFTCSAKDPKGEEWKGVRTYCSLLKLCLRLR